MQQFTHEGYYIKVLCYSLTKRATSVLADGIATVNAAVYTKLHVLCILSS